MSNERDAQFSVGCQPWFMSLAATPGHGGMAHQARKLRGSLAEGGIAQCLLNHLRGHVVALQPKRRDEVLNILDDSAVLQAAFYYWTKYAGNVVSFQLLAPRL